MTLVRRASVEINDDQAANETQAVLNHGFGGSKEHFLCNKKCATVSVVCRQGSGGGGAQSLVGMSPTRNFKMFREKQK